LVVDARRGDGPKPAFNYTMAALAATDRLIERSPDMAAAAVRAIRRAHALLKEDVTRATDIGNRLFPPEQAALIAELIRRDLPFYDASVTPDFVAGMNRFARDLGILEADVPYEAVVATQLAPLWRG
jgi:NitT/TauT family transport system substrate-binding protein